MNKLLNSQEVKSLVAKKIAEAVDEHKPKSVAPGGGVFIRITPQGKAFYTVCIKRKERKLGDYPKLGIAQARKLARDVRDEGEKSALMLPFFGMFWKEYRAMKVALVSTKRMTNIDSYYRANLRKFDQMKLNELTPDLVIKTFEQIPVAQNYKASLFQTLNECLNYAVALGKLDHSPLSGYVNSGFNVFKRGVSKGKLFVAAKNLGDVFEKLSNCRPILKFMLLYQAFAMARPNEARVLKWEYVDFQKDRIVLPKDAMKARRPHVVMITSQIRTLLSVIKPFSETKEYVFWMSEAGKPVGSSVLSQMMKHNGLSGIMTPHGFRNCASTWLHENGFNRDDIERCLAHKRITGVEEIYSGTADYSMGMMKVLQAWDDYLYSVLPDDWKNMLTHKIF